MQKILINHKELQAKKFGKPYSTQDKKNQK